jgi:alpha-tubulin suppressor-like RCC1 family protein
LGAEVERGRRLRGSSRFTVVLALLAALVLSGVLACAASASTLVTAWGLNNEGQLGIGNNTGPSKCPFNTTELACSLNALTVSGGLSEPVAVAAGKEHSLALLANGTVMAWGANGAGQLGNGSNTASSVPVAVSGLSEVTAVSAGTNHSLALLANGTVMAWGSNEKGQLGDGTTTSSNVPVAVSGLSEATAISAGDGFSLALRANGTVVAWGTNEVGQLGNGTTTQSNVPVAVSSLKEVTAISAGFAHSLALLAGGTVKAWGYNNFGQLGDGLFNGPNKCKIVSGEVSCAKSPVAVSGLTEASSIAAGERHSLAAKLDGSAVAWGANEEGQLGNGGAEETDVPVTIAGLSEVATVAAGGDTSMALLSGGTVKAWGSDNFGQLGVGSTAEATKPLLVCGVSGVQGIAIRGGHSLAVGTAAPACPTVTHVTPSAGSTEGGTTVTITGTNLGEAIAVRFGSTNATSFKVESATTVSAVSPAGVGTVDITVSTPLGTSGKSEADRFTYAAAPKVTAVSPSAGPAGGGTTVTITGSAFNEASSVTFGSTPATSFTLESPTTIKAVSPAGSGTVDVRVSTPLGTSPTGAADLFTYTEAPEFGRCLKVTPGKGVYGTVTCTAPGGEKKFEWYPAFGSNPLVKRHFTIVNKELTEIHLTPLSGEAITCKAATGAGEYSGPKSVAGVTITLTGCHLGTTGSCTSEGSAEGAIHTAPLSGVLGVVKTSTEGPQKNKIGLDLKPASGATMAEFSCAGIPVVWSGSAITEVKANSMLNKAGVKFTGSKGVQKPSRFEGQPEDAPLLSFNGEAAVKAVFALTGFLLSEEKVEVNSVV